MKNKRTIYFLALLYSAAEGDKREKVGELFKQSVAESQGYQHLKKLILSVDFLGHRGKEKKEESEKKLKNAVSNIDSVIENLKQVEQQVEEIENEIKKTEILLNSAGFFDDDLVAIKKEERERYYQFYQVLANNICYYLISLFGAKAIENLTFNYQSGFQSVVKLVNQQYGDELFMSCQRKKPLTWKISRELFMEDNGISYEGYRIEYSETPFSTLMKYANKGEYRRVSAYVFSSVLPTAQVPYIGIGNLVGVHMNSALSLLDAEIVLSLPIAAFREEFQATEVFDAIECALDTDSYCISPEDFVAALNRQKLSETVAKRRRESKCIFCGEIIGNRVACSRHLKIVS